MAKAADYPFNELVAAMRQICNESTTIHGLVNKQIKNTRTLESIARQSSEPSVFGFTSERWLNKHEHCAKLCRACGSQKHLGIDFEPFVCRIERKAYRVIEKNSEETPHLF